MSWRRQLYGRNPWWLPPYLLGRVPEGIEPRALSLLGFVSFALFFEQYDLSLLNNALKYISADLAIPETRLGFFQMWIRLGALPALALVPLADRLGRRRLFLASVVGMSFGALITSFSQSSLQFIAAQMVMRSFILTASAVAGVMVIEEFPAQNRGWAVGMLAAVAAVGHGMGALVFGVIKLLPFGWRPLYAFGFAPILLLPLFRAGIAETGRFVREQRRARAPGRLLQNWTEPLRLWLRSRPERALGMAAVATFCALGHAVVMTFTGYFVLEYHGWEPHQLSLMVVGGGTFGLAGNVVAGRMADRVGRRGVGALFLCVFPLAAWIFFHAPGWLLVPVWALLVFFFMGGNVIVRALSSELFPTSHRGTSTGMLVLLETVGAATGFGLLGLQQQEPGDLAFWIPLLSNGSLLGGLILLALPETGRRELEEISAEPELGGIRDRLPPEATEDRAR